MKPEPRKLVTRGVEEEPGVGSGEIPVLFFGVLAGLVFLGLLYLDKFAGGFNNMVYRPFESYAQVLNKQPNDPVRKRINHGQEVYKNTCSICHQPTGLGTPPNFPPLDGSEWVNGPALRVIRIPVYGLQGPITIKGEAWNASMPAIGAALSDEDMADLLSYIRQAWSNKAGPVTVEQVKKVKADEAARTQQVTSDDLLKVQGE